MEEILYKSLPLIALRGLTMFPRTVLHFNAGRDKSIAALNAAMKLGKEILLVSQIDIRDEEPTEKDLYTFGCTAKIRQMLKISDDEVRVLVEGVERAEIVKIEATYPYYIGTYLKAQSKMTYDTPTYVEAQLRHIKKLFESYIEVTPHMPPNVVMTVRTSDNLGFLIDYIAANIELPTEDKQALLCELDVNMRADLLSQILEREIEILAIDLKIAEKVKSQMDKNQREYYMHEELKALNEELYGTQSGNEEKEELTSKIKSLNAPTEVKDKLFKEVDKLTKMPQGSQEYALIENYIETCLELPFGVYTTDRDSLKKASDILEKEHYGLKNVKERITEALAVNMLTGNPSGSILCLVGPPGVGKTSIAKSVAHALNRRFSRISLGGVHDEAEIRGHRRTYVASMPGRIIDAVRHSGSANPVILLDEIDKLGNDYKGDPASALLEALDPEQNSTFKDHYVDMPFDLSKVLFLTTANTKDTIPAPLLDRMEIIEIGGYTKLDKLRIAKKYLVKKQLEKNGLKKEQLKISQSALVSIVDYYTRESGVRKLEQKIAEICRKCAKKILLDGTESISVNDKNLEEFLGKRIFVDDLIPETDEVGYVNGLAYTSVGGTLCPIEVSVLDGSGKTELTGSLGDVMKESANTAISYVRSIAEFIVDDKHFYKNKDFHINAPESAVPKDGPSAGITMVTALVSALTGIPVKRDVAMTGEITLRGKILPIGGLKEKSMAAYSAGVKTVFIPKANLKDLDEVDEEVKKSINFIAVDNAWEVLNFALTDTPKVSKAKEVTGSLTSHPIIPKNISKSQKVNV